MRALALLAAAAALLAGCGAEQAAQAELDVDEVAQRTADASSARIEMDMRLVGPDGKPPAELEGEDLASTNFTAEGAIAEDGRLFRLQYTMARSALGIGGSGDVRFDAILDSESGDAWFRYPAALGIALPEGKEWVHTRAEELEGLQATSDPGNMVSYLYAAGDLRQAGEETVRGDHTTRYEATMHLDRALEQFPENQRKQMEKGIEALQDMGIETVPMVVWIDDDGYLRRLNMDWRLDEVDGAPEGARLKIHVELWDFGADVDVSEPKESTVVEEGELG
jgi:hypothetical protein